MALAIPFDGGPSLGHVRSYDHPGNTLPGRPVTKIDQILHYCALAIAITALFLLSAPAAGVAGTPAQRCEKGRYTAAAKYAQREQQVMAKLFGGANIVALQPALTKCRLKYADTWTKLQEQANGTGTTCDRARFAVGGGTVRDNLTGLEWEQTTDDASIHDVGNIYRWSDPLEELGADGTAFTSFLATLNGGACFASQCDWRLPTRAELQTILSGPYPCTTSPCADQTIFGPTATDGYWSSTTVVTLPHYAWYVNFYDGFVNFGPKGGAAAVRAVRGGL